MKKKFLLFCTIAVIAMGFSSCYVENGHRHWGHHHHHHHDDAAIIVR